MPDTDALFTAEIVIAAVLTYVATLFPVFQQQFIDFDDPEREVRTAYGLLAAMTGLLCVLFITIRSNTMPVLPTGFAQIISLDTLLRQLMINGLCFAPFAIATLNRQGWSTMRFSRHNLRPSIFLGLGAGLVSVLLWRRGFGAFDAEVYSLIAALSVGFVEEAVFRGYLQTRLAAWRGERWAWLATAVIFTLWHIPQRLIVRGVSIETLIPDLASVFVLGLLFGWMAYRTENITAPAIFHALHNWSLG